MTVFRLNNIAGLIKYWDFFRKGIEETSRFLRYDIPMDTYRQMMQHVIRQPNAWVGICLDDESGDPLGFGIAHECTPLFSSQLQYEASIVYSEGNNQQVFTTIQQSFEDFCRAHGVKCYFATTRRDSGATIRCFQSPQYGFKRAYTVFKKDLK